MPEIIQLPSGATETDIIQALARLPNGGTVVLPHNETIPIRSGLVINVAQRDITLDLNGSTLQQAANVSVISGRGQHTPLQPVTLGQDASGHTTMTYAAGVPANLTPGTWVKIVADDVLPGDHLDAPNMPTRLGQAMQVASVEGNKVTLEGALLNQQLYMTNVRATVYQSGELTVKNGDIVGDQSQTNRSMPLVEMRNAVEPHIENLSIHDGAGNGISIVDSVNAQITDVTVKNLLNSPTTLGIAVHSLSSFGTMVDGLYAEKVAHAADDNSVGNAPNSPDASYYGADIGMNVHDSVAYNTTNFAWSWHSEANNGLFDNVMAFDSYGFLDARGIGNTMIDSAGANNQRGVILFEWGDGDGRNITLDDVTLKETLYYSTIAINQPRDNHINDSFFEAYESSSPVDPQFATTTNTTYVRADSQENDVLTGTENADQLLGGKGNDTLSGGGGNDFLWGGTGVDTLTGGEGRDRFAFHSPSDAVDLITDFTGGANGDVIDLSVLAIRLDWPRDDLIGQGYVRFVQDGANTDLQIDTDGGGNNFATLAILQNVDANTLGPANLLSRLSQESNLTSGSSATLLTPADPPAPLVKGGSDMADANHSPQFHNTAAAWMHDDFQFV